MTLVERYRTIRQESEAICAPLQTEDYVVQPVDFVSPPKWHLGHTTWFFEEMILKKYSNTYKPFNKNFAFVFNSYYESIGNRIIRTNRGNLSRPTVMEVLEYRQYVDRHMETLILGKEWSFNDEANFLSLVELGLQHEQQHQELLLMDIKYILGHNPLFPHYKTRSVETNMHNVSGINSNSYITISEGLYSIGHKGEDFCFDNELGRHQVYVDKYHISETLVTNELFYHFILDKGYKTPSLWTSDGLEWVRANKIKAPMYWHVEGDHSIQQYTLIGLHPIDLRNPVTHVSWYEAQAFAKWMGKRLPTEAEWEIASYILINKGLVWEHTSSAYLPYPGFKEFPGLAQEYNGKFMINQMVSRGSSVFTPPDHSRDTYRNFFHPNERWFMGGIRLAY